MHKSTEQIMSQIYELKIAKPGETYVEGMFRVTHDRYFRQYDRIFKAWVDKEHSREISIHGISEINGQDKSMSLESSSLDLGAYLEGRPMTVISTAQSHINPSKVR